VTQVSQQTGIGKTIITSIEVNNFAVCGGDFHAREYIRSMARAVGADPEPLVREYSMARPWVRARTDDTQPIPLVLPVEPAERVRQATLDSRFRLSWIIALVLVWLGLAGYDILAGSLHATSAAPSAQSHPVPAHGHATPGGPKPSASKATTPGPVRASRLIPASATAFGPYAAGHGDHSDMAQLAIDADPATAWQTDWYTTAHFGGLYPGTGLLVDMGRPTTITAAQVLLGRAYGADFQLRVGGAAALADLRPVAHVTDAGRQVHLQLATSARGRYVLIWFTSLPPNPSPAGTFRASVYSLRLEGRP
jgi:hypothetical protein